MREHWQKLMMRLGVWSPEKIMYIGGSDTLPLPLSREEERELIERMEAELGYETTVIATGGIAKFVIPMCKRKILYDKDLLVKGLATLYRENKRPDACIQRKIMLY